MLLCPESPRRQLVASRGWGRAWNSLVLQGTAVESALGSSSGKGSGKGWGGGFFTLWGPGPPSSPPRHRYPLESQPKLMCFRFSGHCHLHVLLGPQGHLPVRPEPLPLCIDLFHSFTCLWPSLPPLCGCFLWALGPWLRLVLPT